MSDEDKRLAHACVNKKGDIIGWLIFCPACKHGHFFKKGMWTFDNNDHESPSFSPSMLVHESKHEPYIPRCHTFVKEGKIQFLSDCSHDMAGKTVDLEPF